MNHNILVVAAHPDDEVLGVGGTILKHVKNGNKVSLLILGDGETSKNQGADIVKREVQAKAVAENLGISELVLEKLPDNKFDSLPLLDIVRIIEAVVERLKPELIYTHWEHDLNVDHRLVCQAVLTACRPLPGSGVKKILAFETLSSTEWQSKNQSNIFCPNEYNDISGFVEKKIEVLEVYKDELKAYPHPRSAEGVRILAKYRGLEAGYEAAEAFQIIRNLKD